MKPPYKKTPQESIVIPEAFLRGPTATLWMALFAAAVIVVMDSPCRCTCKDR